VDAVNTEPTAGLPLTDGPTEFDGFACAVIVAV
jgi:hypothetical protein